jgi:methionyl-tRNA formyltransferase
MTRALRILLFGDGAWATNSLLALRETEHCLLGVVLRARPSDARLVDVARSLGLPLYHPRNANSPEFLAAIASLQPDLNLSISYDRIARSLLLTSAPLGFVNFHAGMLPFYRGRNVINWAIINGEQEIGLTSHYADEGIDTGDIILHRTLPIGWTDTYGDVLERVVQNFPALVLETVDLIAAGRAERRPQAHLIGTYFGGREEGDEWLDWSDSSVNLHNKVRAITRPGPGARSILGDTTVVIWRAYCDPAWPKYVATPGQVVGRHQDGVLVKTGDSTLLVKEVQIDGGEPMMPMWRIGTRLGINLASYLSLLQKRVKILELESVNGRTPYA